MLEGADTPASVIGHGPIPAALARQVVRDAERVWLRRLFTRPDEGSLVAMDSRRRTFEGELRRFLVLRDETCRTPWCDAPVRHADHVIRARDGGTTTADNGQGLCESCNYAKEASGWQASRIPHQHRHLVQITTPTGHSHLSAAHDPPTPRTPRLDVASLYAAPSDLEERLIKLTVA